MRPHHGMTSEVAFSVVPDGDSGAGLYVVVCDDESVRPFPDAGSVQQGARENGDTANETRCRPTAYDVAEPSRQVPGRGGRETGTRYEKRGRDIAGPLTATTELS